MADSRVKSVSELLARFFDAETVAQGERQRGFRGAWKSIAGARLGGHSAPVDIRRGVLIVVAEHQGWMQLLQLRQDRILEEISRKFPDLGIRSLAFRLGDVPEGGQGTGNGLQASAVPGRAGGGAAASDAGSAGGGSARAEGKASAAPAERGGAVGPAGQGAPAGDTGSLPPALAESFARMRARIDRREQKNGGSDRK